MSLITGTCFIRDVGATHRDKKLFLLMGQLWVPADTILKPEHKYTIIGSQFSSGDVEQIIQVGLQILPNSAADISHETRKKHPSQIVPLLHVPHP